MSHSLRQAEHALARVHEIEQLVWRADPLSFWRGEAGNARIREAATQARSALYRLADALEEDFDQRRADVARRLADRYRELAEPQAIAPWMDARWWRRTHAARRAAAAEAARARIALANDLAPSVREGQRDRARQHVQTRSRRRSR